MVHFQILEFLHFTAWPVETQRGNLLIFAETKVNDRLVGVEESSVGEKLSALFDSVGRCQGHQRSDSPGVTAGSFEINNDSVS